MPQRKNTSYCQLITSDCQRALLRMEAASVDAVVTDPPYGLEFMGKDWDGEESVAFDPYTWRLLLRATRRGGYLLGFGGTRTFHRLTIAIEKGGWELIDTLCWLHGQGFPKGKGQLKPAWEPILLARKPGGKVLELGIDECRIGTTVETWPVSRSYAAGRIALSGRGHGNADKQSTGDTPTGRWPANLVLSHHEDCVQVGVKEVRGVKAGLRQPGLGYHGGAISTTIKNGSVDGLETVESWTCHEDCPVRMLNEQSGGSKTGGASRFFYCSKASRSEREKGLEGMLLRHGIGTMKGDADGSLLTGSGNDRDTTGRNHHPTVKPLKLMEWLVKLACPLGGIVLDPFMGSGSTGCAALKVGRNCVGIEQEVEYVEIAKKRIGVYGRVVAGV